MPTFGRFCMKGKGIAIKSVFGTLLHGVLASTLIVVMVFLVMFLFRFLTNGLDYNALIFAFTHTVKNFRLWFYVYSIFGFIAGVLVSKKYGILTSGRYFRRRIIIE